jgi:hypothetical protein
MTKENAKRLYEHYVEVGYKEAAEDMLKKHPELGSKAPAKETKSKVKR